MISASVVVRNMLIKKHISNPIGINHNLFFHLPSANIIIIRKINICFIPLQLHTIIIPFLSGKLMILSLSIAELSKIEVKKYVVLAIILEMNAKASDQSYRLRKNIVALCSSPEIQSFHTISAANIDMKNSSTPLYVRKKSIIGCFIAFYISTLAKGGSSIAQKS